MSVSPVAKTVDGVNAIVLRFQERDKPRVVETKDDAAARGRFWIEPVGDLRSGGRRHGRHNADY